VVLGLQHKLYSSNFVIRHSHLGFFYIRTSDFLPSLMPDVLFLSTDLMFSSRVTAAAQGANVSLQTVAKIDVAQSYSAVEPAAVPRLVILDLSTTGMDVAANVAAWRALEHPPRIVAYAPHVHEARLAAARAAECDAVYTKGQFDSKLDAILASAGVRSEDEA
jgi:CheY-like chemotaxis protein